MEGKEQEFQSSRTRVGGKERKTVESPSVEVGVFETFRTLVEK